MCAPSGSGWGWAVAFAAWRWLGAPLGANEWSAALLDVGAFCPGGGWGVAPVLIIGWGSGTGHGSIVQSLKLKPYLVQLSKHSIKPWDSKVAAVGSGALQKFAAAFEAASAGFLEIGGSSMQQCPSVSERQLEWR
ncbi:hypothetical protein B0H13DRAFT_1910234 [Mycena leptocephala]|nr:hypothetical protein B0H13DRAFT_1910234 [Mycena leptocephala]